MSTSQRCKCEEWRLGSEGPECSLIAIVRPKGEIGYSAGVFKQSQV
jgi:hypothetical protein